MKRFIPLVFLLLFVLIVFKPFIFEGKVPIPADTIAGLYHPWRDKFSSDYPSGVPFKNFQITDSVRQQYPWRNLSLNLIEEGELPRWNPYSFSGTPLLANFQSAVFYPLNALFILPNFPLVWGILVLLQPLLGGIFMYLYLRSLKLHPAACVTGMLAWVGSGFFIAWLEWNTVVHVVIWMPLILLSIDKLIARRTIVWCFIYVFSLVSSFLAGYLQPFFYVFLLCAGYLVVRLYQNKKYNLIPLFLVLNSLFLILILPQLIPTLKFIGLSARDVDQANWNRPDWFLPWQNLAQFIAPDYFGNPATLNYFGVWNYQEFVGYVGLSAFLMSLTAIIFRRDKKTWFFGAILLIALVFALPNPIAKLPFELNLPFLSTAQPSRVMVIIDFCLAILAALGIDYLFRRKFKLVHFIPCVLALGSLVILWWFAYQTNNQTSIRNLYLPTFIFVATSVLILFSRYRLIVLWLIPVLLLFDQTRFAVKFEPFSDLSYLYPSTKITSYLEDKSKSEVFRVASLDERIMPPNFNVSYKIQMPSGYDPLYLKRYGEFVAMVERGKPDISSPWGFNRIITPKNYTNKLYDLFNVRYFITFEKIEGQKLIMEEGQTKLYEKNISLPRAFFVSKTTAVTSQEQAIKSLYSTSFNPQKDAVVENFKSENYSGGTVKIKSYKENSVILETQNEATGFLVLLDAYYPSWKATVDGRDTEVYITNYTFRGIEVPKGNHTVQFFIE